MEYIHDYIDSVQYSAVSNFLFTYFDFVAYTLGFYMVFLFWCPGLVKRFIISRNVINSSSSSAASPNSDDAMMAPLGSPKIACVQFMCNLILCTAAAMGLGGVIGPLNEVMEEVGFHDTFCVYQDGILEGGSVVFWMCVFCIALYADVLYSIPMAAQNIYKQLEVAKNHGLPAPAKVVSGIRFFEYVYRGTTMAAPWLMITIKFTVVLAPLLVAMCSMIIQHALLAIENVMVIRAPALAAKYELKFMTARTVAHIVEGVVGFTVMMYTYNADDCFVMPYLNRITILYYAFIIFFCGIDLKNILQTGENPMRVIYKNILLLPENRAEKLKQN